MNLFGILAVTLSLVLLLTEAFPSSPYDAPVIPILKDDRTQDRYGGYSFDFRTGNGIYRNEAGKQSYGQNTEGGWSYTSPERVPVKITFVADKGGYQPVGSIIPTPPSLPYSRTQHY